jgi:hypothetical protein
MLLATWHTSIVYLLYVWYTHLYVSARDYLHLLRNPAIILLSAQEYYTSNQLLNRARKARFPSQREFGTAVSEKLNDSISISYAQKKASLWESGHLTPTLREMRAMSELLKVPFKELEESFSGVLPFSTADLVRNLATAPGQGLIASCFAGRVRSQMLEEDRDAFREALRHDVSVAIFFPFLLVSTAERLYSEVLTNHHRIVWRSVVAFWKDLRSLDDGSDSTKVKLYRPLVTGGASVLCPPMFHRSTLLCERANGRTKVDLYTWTQGSENDGFYGVGGRSLEDSEFQAQAWELFFGGVFDHWNEKGELPEGDAYWQAYTGPSEADGDR